MKKGLLLLILLVGFCSSVYASPVKWTDNGHYYEYTLTGYNPSHPLFWEDAKVAAESKGGYLATITSSAEDTFIWNNVSGGQLLHSWLGGYQPVGSAEPDGGWRWVTGEKWDYTNWYPSEPNNFFLNNSTSESALELGRFTDQPRFWNDLDPHVINYEYSYVPGYLTEWNSESSLLNSPAVAPEPVSSTLFLIGGGTMLLKRMRKKIIVT